MPDQTSPFGDDFPCCTAPTPRAELSREHLEVFAVDPHAAAESEVAAMAQELVAARPRITEMERFLDAAYARITEMESERAAATEASLGGGVYSFAFDRARASAEHILTTDAWRDKLSAADRASLVDQLDTAMRAGMEPAIANAVVAGSVLAGRARFAELEKRVAELEGERDKLARLLAAESARLAELEAQQQPRVITDLAELDRLPPFAVIRAGSVIYQHVGYGVWLTPGVHPRTHSVRLLQHAARQRVQVIVLWTPEQEAADG